MAVDFAPGLWGVILGGSSGFGLAAAHKLAQHGMNLCLVHRAGLEALPRIEPEFEKIRGAGVKLLVFDADAFEPGRRAELVGELAGALGGGVGAERQVDRIVLGERHLAVDALDR